MTTILLTGASGVLGSHLHTHMLTAGRRVIATDIRPAHEGRDVVEVDLFNADAVDSLVEGVDEIVHFGAISNEKTWSLIQSANVEGTRNIFESARKHGVRRVIFASSYHVMGFHQAPDAPIRLDAPVRPDTMYAVSKLFGESYGRYCYDRYGLECLVVRICTAFPPKSSRDARNFCDRDDLARLVDCGLNMPELGFRTVYALSDNPNPFFVNEPDPALTGSRRHHPGRTPPSIRKPRSISRIRSIAWSVALLPFHHSSSGRTANLLQEEKNVQTCEEFIVGCSGQCAAAHIDSVGAG